LGVSLSAAETYIFVDDSAIASKQGVTRVLHAGTKLPRPVLEAGRPWEGRRIYTYGSVHFDAAQGLFHMWYNARVSSEVAGRFENPFLKHADVVLHATSRDGIHWTRANAGVYAFDGSKANNVVHHFHSPSVVVDDSDPARRYTMAGSSRIFKGYSLAFSADGIHWRDAPYNPVIPSSDTVTLTRNPANGEYMMFHKWGAEVRGFRRRTIWLSTSRDRKNWSKPELVLAPDEIDDQWARGPGQRTEMYVMSAFPYAGQFLGLVSMFRITSETDRAKLKAFSPSEPPSGADGPIDIQLAVSKDGRKWERTAERKPVIALGAPGSFDAGCILGVSNAVVNEDEVWVYYTAITTTHGGDLPAKRISIGRASWRLDGFASLHAEKGDITTVPLPLAGKRVLVNAGAAGGRVEVEVLDAAGKPIAGFARSDCRALSGAGVRQLVRWKGGERVPAQAKSLRVFLEDADLYAIRLEAAPATGK
jgi:hypothetical protein